MTEYCPAQIYRGQGIGVAVGAPAATWAYTLSALGPRTVSGSILVQADAGWFTFAFGGTALVQHTVAYKTPYSQFRLLKYESAPLYVRFPTATRIIHWWVNYVTTSGDANFGWDAKGTMHCMSPPGVGGYAVRILGVEPFPGLTRLTPELDLSLPPAAGVPISAAIPVTEPLGFTACAQPFSSVRVVTKAMADFPSGVELSDLGATHVETAVVVAVGASGHVDDAWVYNSSGIKRLDASALVAARDSTYAAGTALCQPAPGYFLFTVSFNSAY
jgi:hypothetical protein